MPPTDFSRLWLLDNWPSLQPRAPGGTMARVHRELQLLLAATVLLGTIGHTQDSPNGQIPAGDLVRAVIANELKPQTNATRWMYQLEKEEAGTVQTKEIIETKDGSLDKLIAVSGKSLTPQQQRQEAERIVKLARDPEQRHKLEQARKKDEEQCRNFLQMIPDAFTFSYAGQDSDLVKVKFAPNPKFQPPSREARVLHELEGEMWLHRSQQRLANISGYLVNEVKFGGGFLGHLEKGGQFVVKRDEVAPGDWEMTSLGWKRPCAVPSVPSNPTKSPLEQLSSLRTRSLVEAGTATLPILIPRLTPKSSPFAKPLPASATIAF